MMQTAKSGRLPACIQLWDSKEKGWWYLMKQSSSIEGVLSGRMST